MTKQLDSMRREIATKKRKIKLKKEKNAEAINFVFIGSDFPLFFPFTTTLSTTRLRETIFFHLHPFHFKFNMHALT